MSPEDDVISSFGLSLSIHSFIRHPPRELAESSSVFKILLDRLLTRFFWEGPRHRCSSGTGEECCRHLHYSAGFSSLSCFVVRGSVRSATPSRL